jgi:hypothetical protein
MVTSLLTFPARATLRAVAAFVSTEPVPTILFGAAEDMDYEPTPHPETPHPETPTANPAEPMRLAELRAFMDEATAAQPFRPLRGCL